MGLGTCQGVWGSGGSAGSWNVFGEVLGRAGVEWVGLGEASVQERVEKVVGWLREREREEAMSLV